MAQRRPSRQGQDEIDLGPGGRAVEGGFRPGRGGRHQGLDDEALEARAGDGMAEHGIEGLEPEQRVHEAAVADIDLG